MWEEERRALREELTAARVQIAAAAGAGSPRAELKAARAEWAEERHCLHRDLQAARAEMLSALDEAALARQREAAADDALGVSMEQQRVVALTSPHVRHVDAHTSLAAARFSPHPSTPYATAPPPASPAYASLPTYHQRQSPAPLYGGAYAYSPR